MSDPCSAACKKIAFLEEFGSRYLGQFLTVPENAKFSLAGQHFIPAQLELVSRLIQAIR